ncbi:MAG: PAS domain S-box protein [Deltaproteobacteria bacterium]|uniref:histidine kinase n=1 Tax=Candidatus Zymogenus saltonus TaxID=2844893 RepID=A0A9D8KDZ4_9DELT|nr:PAS domain S-box protein [Candidatus Zymogenus saltonus]
MKKPIRILYIEDNPADVRLAREMLSESPGEFHLETANRLSEGLRKLSTEEYDVVLTDLGLPDSSGFETFYKAYSVAPQTPFVILSGLSDENLAIQAVKDGAQSYLLKDKINPFFLRDTIKHSIERCRLLVELRKTASNLRERVKELNCLHEILKIVEKEDADVEDLVQRIVDTIPPAFLNPENTVARIKVGDREFRSRNFKEAKSLLSEPILLSGEQLGGIEIHLLEDTTKKGAEPFLEEERNLVKTISERIGRIIERNRAEDKLKKSEEKHRRLFETMAQGVVYQDREGKITSANPAAEKILGLTLDQMTGRTSIDPRWKAVHEDGSDFQGDTHPSMAALKTGKAVENQIMGVFNPSDDGYRWIDVNAVPICSPDEKEPYKVYTTFTDITQLQNSRNHINHLNRLLSSIRNINQLIVKEKDKDVLLKKVCEILVEVSGYFFVWIGFINEEHKKVVPIAKWGFDNGYLDNITITWDGDVTAKGPTGTAIKTKKTCVFNDLMNNPDYDPWKEEAEKRGYKSAVSVPFVYQDTLYGTLNVYADTINYFCGDEIALLEEAAQDIAYALSYIDKEEIRRQAEIDLRESQRKLSTLISNLPGIAYRCKTDEYWTMEFISEGCYEITGYGPEDFIDNKNVSFGKTLNHPDDQQYIRDEIENALKEKRPYEITYRIISADGREKWLWERGVGVPSGESDEIVLEGFINDITAQKTAEEKILYLKQFNENVVNFMVDPIDIIDESYRIVFQNRAAKERFGNGEGNICHEFYLGIDAPCNGCTNVKTINEHRQFIKETILPDGSIFEIHTTPILMPEGHYCSMEIMRDITERKRAEDALKKSEASLNKAQKVSHVGSWEWNIKEDRVKWSDEMYRIFGIEKENFTGNLEDVIKSAIHPDDRSAVESANMSVINDKKSLPLEYRVVLPDGKARVVWAEAGELILDNGGNASILTGIVQDITERKRAEQEIGESEEKWRGLFENSIEAVFTVDLKGNFTSMNDALAEVMGYEREEIIGSNFKKFADPEEIEYVFNAYNNLYSTGEPVRNLVYKTIRKDGEARTLEVYLNLIREGNKITGFQGILRDITDRKRAEEALQNSEAQLSNALRIARAGNWEYDVAGDTFTFSDNFYTIFRTTAEEMGGYRLSSADYARRFCHPDDVDIVGGEVKAAIETTDPNFSRQLEHRILYADGEVGHIAVRFFIVKDGEGRTVKTYGVNQDITEHYRAAEELRKSEEKYRTIIENIEDGYFEVDVKGNFTFFNDSMCRILGYSEAEMLGMNNRDYMDEATAAEVYEVFNEVFKTKKAKRVFDWELIRKDGNGVFVSTSVTPIMDKEGNVIGFRGIARDITEKKRAEEALHASETRYRRLFEAAKDGILILNADTGRIEDVNPFIKILLGYSHDELLGKELWEIGVFKDIAANKENFLELQEKKYVRYEDQLLQTKGGKEVHVEFVSNVYSVNHKKVVQCDIRDITERKKAEATLVESERILNSTGQIAAIGGWEHDLVTGKAVWTKALYDIIEIPYDEEPPGVDEHLDFYPSRDREILFEAYNKAIENGTLFDLDLQVYTSKKKLIWCRVRGEPVYKDGECVGLRGIFQNITEQKRIDDALKKSEESYRSLVENISSVIFNLDVEGNFTYISPRVKSVLKYDIEDLMGKSFHSFIHPDDLPLLLENREKVLKGTSASSSLVFRAIDKDGNTVFVNSSGRPTIKDGEIVGVTAIINDVTEQKKMDDALKKSEESYRSLVENVNDVIFNIDAEGNFTYISPRIADISKYDPEDLMDKPFSDFIYSDDLPLLLESRERTQKGIIEPFEYRVVDKDGAIIFVRSSSRLIKKDGEVMGMTGVITDITERKKLEGQLIQAEKLSSLGGILSGVAHELNNPLTSIIGNAQILMRRDIPSDIKDKLEVIMKESIRSSKIVGGLLAFAREHKSEKKMVAINDIIFESYRLREYELRVDDVKMNLNLSEDIPKTSADPYQLQQVFINMINNAHDALVEKNGGTLDIFTLHKGDRIVIEFKDDGIGIPKEHLKKIFDPFFTTKEVGKGTGLGMSIVYGIITDHNGTIDVESEVGKGTKFIIQLPITQEIIREEEEEYTKAVEKPEGKIRVLVVEDEESLRDFLVEALEVEGYIVEMAKSGEEAIELIKCRDYDIIITDMKMPGLTGESIYNYVKKTNQALTERMVFITGDILGKETQNFFKVSDAKFIEKPFEIDELLSVLVELLVEKRNIH